MTGWLAGWRAAVRIARRDAWRNKGRSLLIALMVAIPVLAASVVSVLYQSDRADPRDLAALRLGAAAQASVTWSPDSQPLVQDASGENTSSNAEQSPQPLTRAQFERRLAAAMPASDRIVVRVTAWQQLVGVQDRLVHANVSEFAYDALGSGGPLEQLTGRAPQADGEVAVTRALARAQKVKVGDRLSYGSGTLTVVGVVGGLPALGQSQVIGRPGALLTPELETPAAGPGFAGSYERTWFVGGPAPVSWAAVQQVNQVGGTVLSRAVLADPPPISPELADDYAGSLDSGAVATAAVVVGLVLLQIALMAGPAIAVGTRRNERSLAVVAAAGGEGRHLRAVVLAGSALVGLVASLAAVLAGAAVGAGLVLVLRARWEVGFARIDLHLLDLAVLVLVGALTAFAAALLPARRVGRLDVVAALTGRRPQRVPRLRAPLTGLLISAAGLALAWFAAGQGRQFLTVLGLAAAEVGLVVASPAVVGLTARLSSRTSFAARFAFRDAARQRGRTAPAVAAVLAAIAGGTTAIVFAHASSAADRYTYSSTVPYGAVDVNLDPSRPGYRPQDAAAALASLRRTLPVTDVAVLREAKPDTNVTVWKACDRDQLDDDSARTVTSEVDSVAGSCDGYGPLFTDESAAAVFAPKAAAEVTAQVRAALAAGKVVVFGDGWVGDGTVRITVSRRSEGSAEQSEDVERQVPAVAIVAGQRLAFPLVPLSLARSLAIPLQPTQVAAATGSLPDTLAEGRAQRALQSSGLDVTLTVERGYQGQPAVVVLALLVAAALVALIGTFTAVGLAAAEGRADLGTLAAVGAAPGLRRRLGAAQAGAIVVPGAILGLLSGTAAGWVLIRLNARANAQWQDPAAWHLALPWLPAAALGLGIPALAVAVGFLTVRSRLVLVRRLGE